MAGAAVAVEVLPGVLVAAGEGVAAGVPVGGTLVGDAPRVAVGVTEAGFAVGVTVTGWGEGVVVAGWGDGVTVAGFGVAVAVGTGVAVGGTVGVGVVVGVTTSGGPVTSTVSASTCGILSSLPETDLVTRTPCTVPVTRT